MTNSRGTRTYPRDIQPGQQIRIAFQAASGRRDWQWRTVIAVEPVDQHTAEIRYLNTDGSSDLGDRMQVARNSKHDVRG
jgi:hypothetical protein